MKKFQLSVCLAAFGLTACSSGVADLRPVNASDYNMKHLCLKGNTYNAPDDFVGALKKSLKNKGISAEFVKEKGNCDRILFFTVKGNSRIIARAKLDLRDVASKQSLGFLTYKRRGDEKDRVDQVGLQGQTDLMINQLFQ
ncbi:hypothetical protein [Aggregatibacter kilianii]|uniref:hypothetical protein n=1 Tax=Aggregatibacter kilianii TaxID=2025884 RepID=UPI001EF775E0|nr:hypothetical protein [Aggregatibacter kilianii]